MPLRAPETAIDLVVGSLVLVDAHRHRHGLHYFVCPSTGIRRLYVLAGRHSYHWRFEVDPETRMKVGTED